MSRVRVDTRTMATATTEAAVTAYGALATALRKLDALEGAESILSWDELVVMPDAAADARAKQKEALAEVLHEMRTAESLDKLIASAEDTVSELVDPMQRASVRDARKAFDRKKRMPAALAALEAQLGSTGYHAWAKAREESNFSTFAPVLQRLVDMRREESRIVAPDSNEYDYQIDKFERGMRAERLGEIFDTLKEGLVPLIQKVCDAPQLKLDERLKGGHFDAVAQEKLCEDVSRALGFKGLFNTSLHPFTGGVGPSDVRITTRFEENNVVSGIMGVVHETGHALYEQNRPTDEYNGLPVSHALSMGIHESMSLLFERNVGQSAEFWELLIPKLAEHFETCASLTPQDCYAAVNRVERSLIRVDADELTYPLHIVIRFEIERGLFDGSIDVNDLPRVWNAKYKKYLDIEPPNDAAGCLQDIHWSDGSFGYFPSYSLGAMFAAQFFAAAEEALPTLRDDIRQGNFDALIQWLKEKIHSTGSLHESADDLCVAVTGRKLDPAFYLNYLQTKYFKLYGLEK